MAIVHSSLPSHAGELELAKHLQAVPDVRLHLWFSVRQVPGVRDIDIIIWHEAVGVFAVEVKAVPLHAVEFISWSRCKINGRSEGKNPSIQAHEANDSLRNFLGSKFSSLFVTSVACWPKIRRENWNERWRNTPKLCGTYTESMLMYEDLFSDAEDIADRLRVVRKNPNIGETARSAFYHKSNLLEMFSEELDPQGVPAPTVSDLDRLQAIEKTIRKREKDRVPPGKQVKLLFTGKPGTGKTFRLLQIAHWHVTNDCRVLYVCFNKVLGADVRRLLQLSERLKLVSGELQVCDLYEFLMLSPYTKGIEIKKDDYDVWAQLVVDEMRKNSDDLVRYHTILVDEAQDLPDWAFEMIDLYAKNGAAIVVAAGSGQELYREEAGGRLKALRDTATIAPLNRNFRNTEMIIKTAMAYFDANGDISKLDPIVRKLTTSSGTELQLEFDRSGGSLPSLVPIDESSLENCSESDLPMMQREVMVSEYKRLIKQEIDNLHDEQRPLDLLILIPSASSMEHEWAIDALNALDAKYLDYSISGSRRYIAPPDAIRICTYHSSRGIEGQRVIIFGMEKLHRLMPEDSHIDPSQLGYIVLSRASLDLTIAYRPALHSDAIKFISAAIRAFRTHQSSLLAQ